MTRSGHASLLLIVFFLEAIAIRIQMPMLANKRTLEFEPEVSYASVDRHKLLGRYMFHFFLAILVVDFKRTCLF